MPSLSGLAISSKKEAEEALDKWLWLVKESGIKEFKASIRAYGDWKEEILTFFHRNGQWTDGRPQQENQSY